MALLPFHTLASAAATGPGETRDLEHTYRAHGMIVTTTGSPAAFQIDLEISFDGTTWISLGSVTEATNPAVLWSADKPTRFIRANLASFSGGTSPTFDVFITSC